MFSAAAAGDSWLICCIRSYLDDQNESKKNFGSLFQECHSFGLLWHLFSRRTNRLKRKICRDILITACQWGFKKRGTQANNENQREVLRWNKGQVKVLRTLNLILCLSEQNANAPPWRRQRGIRWHISPSADGDRVTPEHLAAVQVASSGEGTRSCLLSSTRRICSPLKKKKWNK